MEVDDKLFFRAKQKVVAMICCKNVTVLTLLLCLQFIFNQSELVLQTQRWPTVFVAVLIRNKAHTLPYFFSCLHRQDYPKDRLFIWLYSDHNNDSSPELVNKWIKKYEQEYNGVNFTLISDGNLHADETASTHWSLLRFKHVINLREEALGQARWKWADFIFMLDADVFLTNTLLLKSLVDKQYPVVAPMLKSDGLYSNFWCGMTENYYYQRSEDYLPIYNQEKVGCFDVPVVHSAVLINLNLLETDMLTYDPRQIKDYDGPDDDVIAFALSSKKSNVTLRVCNDVLHGFLPVPVEEGDDPRNELDQLLNVKLEALSKGHILPLDTIFEDDVTYTTPWKYGCDEIFMINLDRREERRILMSRSFKELGMEVKRFVAVDGRKLDLNNLHHQSIKLMPNYEDPYHKRPMKTGEIGCFLSHYYIWEEILKNGYKITLVLEDDIHFAPYFRQKFLNLLKELENFDWDLVYIGRKILVEDEVLVTRHLAKPQYSYWTLGYLLSDVGAKKLIDAKPLDKMLPVDEFLPIMFDQHPNDTWKSYFEHRNLNAYSAAPLLAHPTHYTGQLGYVSDTEDSHLILPEVSSPRSDL